VREQEWRLEQQKKQKLGSRISITKNRVKKAKAKER